MPRPITLVCVLAVITGGLISAQAQRVQATQAAQARSVALVAQERAQAELDALRQASSLTR